MKNWLHSWLRRVTLALCLLTGVGSTLAAPDTLYSTQFERAQGFTNDYSLAGQGAWIQSGTGGNWIVTDYVTGFGQSAIVGEDPAPSSLGLYVWHPINHNPTNRPLVKFSADIVVFDSSTTNRDVFLWSVYNLAGNQLFALGFDNRDPYPEIYYQLYDGSFHYPGWSFANDTIYTVEIAMDFVGNLWNAYVNGALVVTNQLITTNVAGRTLGDVDATWLAGVPGKAGDNALLFDNYLITADALPPQVQTLGFVNGQFRVRVTGQTNLRYAVEASTNLVNWTALKTNVATGGYFDHLDTGSAGLKQRFYRSRWVP